MLPHTQYLDPLAAAVGYHFGTIKEQHGIKHACTSHCTFPFQNILSCLSQVESHFYPFPASRGKKFLIPHKIHLRHLIFKSQAWLLSDVWQRTFLALLPNDFSGLLFKDFFAKYTEVERVVSPVQLVLKSSLRGLFTTWPNVFNRERQIVCSRNFFYPVTNLLKDFFWLQH